MPVLFSFVVFFVSSWCDVFYFVTLVLLAIFLLLHFCLVQSLCLVIFNAISFTGMVFAL